MAVIFSKTHECINFCTFICFCVTYFSIFLISQFYKNCICVLVFWLHDDSSGRREVIKYCHFYSFLSVILEWLWGDSRELSVFPNPSASPLFCSLDRVNVRLPETWQLTKSLDGPCWYVHCLSGSLFCCVITYGFGTLPKYNVSLSRI